MIKETGRRWVAGQELEAIDFIIDDKNEVANLPLSVASGSSAIAPDGLYFLFDGEWELYEGGGGGETPVYEALSVTENGVYTPEEGVDAFSRVEVAVPQAPSVTLSGNCAYVFGTDAGHKLWNIMKDGVTTENITNADHMFYGVNSAIPFDINMSGDSINMNYMFGGVGADEPIILNFADDSVITSAQAAFSGFSGQFPTISGDYAFSHSVASKNYQSIYHAAHSLRSIDPDFDSEAWGATSSDAAANYSQRYRDCYTLDEITACPVQTSSTMSSGFVYCFDNCHRAKNMKFADIGTKKMKWTNRIVNLSVYFGYADDPDHITENGIGLDKRVTDATTYAALKNDPDWWTTDVNFSRYNHDSAVETINSLPNSIGGINTLKLIGESGTSTDSGAVGDLTEEEIAVASAKSWTLALA